MVRAEAIDRAFNDEDGAGRPTDCALSVEAFGRIARVCCGSRRCGLVVGGVVKLSPVCLVLAGRDRPALRLLAMRRDPVQFNLVEVLQKRLYVAPGLRLTAR
jgi:hypothetical protein